MSKAFWLLSSKLALPYLRTSKNNPHILNISPPLNMRPRWFKDHCAYTMAKYGMSMCVLGMAEEFKKDRIGVNALWPKTGNNALREGKIRESTCLTASSSSMAAIITAAMEMLGGSEVAKQCRTVDIMADAAYVILTRDCKSFTGNFVVDEEILREEGCGDMDQYAAVPGTSDLMPDFFLDEFDDFKMPADSGAKAKFVSGKDTSSAASKSVQNVFDAMKNHLSEELVKKTNAVYVFKVEGRLTHAPRSCLLADSFQS